MTTETYNGWKNRETWAVALHLSNDQSLYTMSRELVESAPGDTGTWEGDDRLKDFVETAVENVYHVPDEAEEWARMLASDAGSLFRVDWSDVADSFRDDV